MPRFLAVCALIVVSITLVTACGGSSPLDIRTPTPGATATRPAAVQQSPTAVASPSPQSNEYTVQSGDTLSEIAAQFGVTVDEIVQLNNLSDPNQIAVGQTILIPVPNP